MKKKTAFFLALLLICASVPGIFAAGQALRLQAQPQADGQIAVTVIADSVYITSAQLLLQFDNTVLDFISGDRTTDNADDEADVRLKSGSDNIVLLNFAALHTAQGAIFKVLFRPKGERGGETDLILKIKSLFTSSGSAGINPQQTTIPCLGTSVSVSGGNTPKDMYYRGDVDMDGNISSADARLALRASVKLETLSEAASFLADADNDGQVTSADARLILRASVKLESL